MWPRTVKRPTVPQPGESSRTVKMTVVARDRKKVSVVVRRFLAPLLAIHVRDESRCLTFGRGLEALRDVDDPEELPDEYDWLEPLLDNDPPSAAGSWTG